MDDARKTKRQLIAELEALRARIIQLRLGKADHEHAQVAPQQGEWSAIEPPPHPPRDDEERRYRHMVENSLGLICVHDFEGNLLYVNPAAAHSLAYPLDAWVGRNLRDFLAPAFRPLFDVYLERIRRQRTDQGFMQVVSRTGEKKIWRYHNVWHEEGGQPLYVLGCAVDVTEQVRLERELRKARDELELRVQERTEELVRANEALRESEERYRSIFENANDIIATFTLEGDITSVNRAAEITLGWSREELLGRHFRNFVTAASVSLVQDRIRQFLAGARFDSNLEVEVFRKDGSIILFECRTRPVLDQRGRPVGFQVIYHDITARRQSEKQLRQAKEAAEAADRAKSEFLATMSHELRTPVNVILGYLELLLEKEYGELTEAQIGILRGMGRNTQGLYELINEVLDFNRLEAGRMPAETREVRVADVLREIEAETQGLRDLSGLTFFWRVAENLPPLTTDAGKLKVVVRNLLSNAIKFTRSGSVAVEARSCEEGVAIDVTDTGIGIPPEQQALIFEAFRKVERVETIRYDGFGLGLHIVKQLLMLLGGNIEVKSEVGKGSTFRIRLPITMEAASRQ